MVALTTRAAALEAILLERDRQAATWNRPHEWGEGDCSSEHVPATVKAAVLAEEVGEVARAVLDRDGDTLYTELVQVAAVALAWLEGDTCTF
jgi:hypothetical protein